MPTSQNKDISTYWRIQYDIPVPHILVILSCVPQDPAATPEYAASSKIPFVSVGNKHGATGTISCYFTTKYHIARFGFHLLCRVFLWCPLNEAALAGEVDVLFTADQPALALCHRDRKWKMIGRLMYNRVGTFVPFSSFDSICC